MASGTNMITVLFDFMENIIPTKSDPLYRNSALLTFQLAEMTDQMVSNGEHPEWFLTCEQ